MEYISKIEKIQGIDVGLSETMDECLLVWSCAEEREWSCVEKCIRL